MSRWHHSLSSLALLASIGCAHAPASDTRLEDVVWPAPPAAPRARLVAVLPDERTAPRERPLWRRALTALAGFEDEARVPPPLVRPFGVALSPDGSVVVTDPEARVVARLDARRVELVACPSRPWSAPAGVAVAPDGSILVADLDAVVRVAPGGRCEIVASGAFARATGVATAGGRIFVADPPRHEVLVLSPSGAVEGRLGGPDGGKGPLHFPSAVAAAPGGDVLVADTFNFSVARFGAGGTPAGRLGGAAEGPGSLARPKGVAAGADGRVYVADAERDVVVVFRADGAEDYRLGATGTEPGKFANPAGVSVSGDRLAVADSLNGRVQVFELIGGAP